MLKKLNNLIKEVWDFSIYNVDADLEFPIYKNPNLKDVLDIKKTWKLKNIKKKVSYRYMIVIKTKELYLWDAYFTLHDLVIKKLNLTEEDVLKGHYTEENEHSVYTMSDEFETVEKMAEVVRNSGISKVLDLPYLELDTAVWINLYDDTKMISGEEAYVDPGEEKLGYYVSEISFIDY